MGRPKFKKHEGPYAVPVSAEEGAPYRNSDYPEIVAEPYPGCTTIFNTFQYAVKHHSFRNALGTRELIKVEEEKDENGREVEKLTLGKYNWITYAQLDKRVANVASGLASFAGVKAHDKVIIYADTKADWLVTALAVFRQSAIVVTIYATLGDEGVSFGVNQTRAGTIVCDSKLLKTVIRILPQCPNLKHIVTIGRVKPELVAQVTAARPDIKVTDVDALCAEGEKKPVSAAEPKKTDIAVIMYTSGTTGNPKGVVLTHEAAVASMTGLKNAGHFTPDDVYLAYLPLAHIMEMAAEVVNLAQGISIGYGSPQTLSDTGLKLAKGVRGDAPTLRPTFMVFAPTVLDRVRQAVQAKVAAAKPLQQKLFNMALQSGYRDYEKGKVGANPLLNAIVFKKVQALLGGRLKVMISGSAPLSADTQKFIQTVFNCPLRQGYGLTETCSAATIGAFDDNTQSAGCPLSSCRIKLIDWPEGSYLLKDAKDPKIRMPRGEILIGGPVVASGYFVDGDNIDPELIEKNKTDFSVGSDGLRYFHTGDIGQFTATGMLQIIDRKKDLVKLQMGEYVALSKVENTMKLSQYVEQCMAYALPSKSNVVALVVPSEKAIRPFAEGKGIKGKTYAQLCEDPAVVAEVTASVKAACKGKIQGFETPTALGLISEPWTPENELVTAAMKLKRPQIAKACKATLDKIYA